MSKKDGGTAFPVFPDTRVGHDAEFRGMSLRDYFAAEAMQGLVSTVPIATPNDIALAAYLVADAMLAEREKDGDAAVAGAEVEL